MSIGRDHMARWGNADFDALKKMVERVEKLGPEMDQVFREVAEEVSAVLLKKVRKRTPVGVRPDDLPEDAQQYWSGYTGGNLRKAWTVEPVKKIGSSYFVTIINNAEYASYVEYGHRQRPGRFVPALGKRLKVSFVPGKYMLHLSVKEVEKAVPKALEKAVNKKLREVFGND